MADIFTRKARKRIMTSIRGVNTKPEIIVRSFLHKKGFRFRLHATGLPGRPDIVLPKFRTAVFVNGCFWHLCPHCSGERIPGTRRSFWKKKLYGNRERDRLNILRLKALGWKVVVVWECQVGANDSLAKHLRKIIELKST